MDLVVVYSYTLSYGLTVGTGCFLPSYFLQPTTFFIFSVFDPLESVNSHEPILESSCLAIVLFFGLGKCLGISVHLFPFHFLGELVKLKQV